MSFDTPTFSLPCRIEALFPEETFTPAVFEATLEALCGDSATLRCARLDPETLNLVMRETRHARIRPAQSEGVVERYRATGKIVWVEDSPAWTRFGVALGREGGDAEIQALTRAAQEHAWSCATGSAEAPAVGGETRETPKAFFSLIRSAKRIFSKPRSAGAPDSGAAGVVGTPAPRKIDCRLDAQFSMQTGAAAFDMASFRATITSVSASGIQASVDEDAQAFRAAMKLSGLSPMKLMHSPGGWLGFDDGGKKVAAWMRLVWIGNGVAPALERGDEPFQAGFALWGGETGAPYGRLALERAAEACALPQRA